MKNQTCYKCGQWLLKLYFHGFVYSTFPSSSDGDVIFVLPSVYLVSGGVNACCICVNVNFVRLFLFCSVIWKVCCDVYKNFIEEGIFPTFMY